MGECDLPFEEGQEVETRSFIKGFRGAWFRCKLKEYGMHRGHMSSYLEYLDFPDEKLTWTRIYQSNSAVSKKSLKTLMLRPRFPPIYHKNTMPDVSTISEVVVIVVDAWKVGDLIDWWKDGCYWSGKITEVLGNDKFKIELHPCPVGEGNPNDEPYEGSRKDLRPSLDWSPENGWTVLTAMERENGNPCARVMKPGNQGGIPSLSTYYVGHGRREKQPLGTITENEMLTSETHAESDRADSGIVKTSCSDSVSSSHLKSASKGVQRTTTEKDRVDNTGSLKKMKTDGSIVLNSMSSDTLEAAILDLEELVNRVKWMKSILEIGMPLASVPPTWKFL